MLPALVIASSTIWASACFVAEGDGRIDETCLLQSYVMPKFSKRQPLKQETFNDASPLHESNHFGHGGQYSLLSTVASSSEYSTRRSRTLDETTQIMIGLLVIVMVAGIIALAFALHSSKDDDYSPHQDVEDFKHDQYADYGGYVERTSSRHDTADSAMKLNSALVVPRTGEMVYHLPDISQQRKSLEAYTVLGKHGKPALGVIVKEGGDDPGVLLHGPESSGGAGAPLAFITTHPEALRMGQLRIAQPSPDHPTGKLFGTLEPDGEAFKVICQDQVVLWIQGSSKGFTITTGLRGSGRAVGTAARTGDSMELHLQGGADSALVVICVLVVMQLSAST
eukprot:gnl/MRDRNA2_/MRDRNA2_109496_c0_seq1.p1 gnl/MRDRNA2_/MRDRNA2_109496_c0~~gnl/MRDRNA2_/MRDRNA2_109496_c0_seq1.p1  ORF type:complete len:338 (-),score=64.81 gnl/MRDRNA2_/MRDRNA2_109496_c0_seq1:186-1199(-)